MEPMLTISGYCMLAAAVISCYKAAEQVLARRTEEHNRMLFVLLLCTGYLLGALGVFFTGSLPALPEQIFLAGFMVFITIAYMAGPAAYLYYQSLIGPVRNRAAAHAAPSAAAALFAVPYLLTRGPAYRAAMQADFFHAPHEAPVYAILAGAVAIITGYTVTILAIEISVRNSVTIRRAVMSLTVVTAGLLLSPLALLAGFLMQRLSVSLAGGLLLAVNILLFIIAHVRYQDFFQYLGSEVRLARQRRSVLKGLDMPRLRARLAALMEEEHYYRNFDTSMASTAEKLSVTPHQLSCFLNRKMRIDFSNFINRYRVEEAKKILEEDPDRNILTICYHVGFGSKTSFNVTFREYTGMTPTRYRDLHRAWTDPGRTPPRPGARRRTR